MSKKILNCRFRRPHAGVRLICFPWAGGGSAFYSNWGKMFSENIEVHGVTLAGRESRYSDPLYKEIAPLMDDVTSAIKAECGDRPFALWGHSLGALLTYEAVCVLKERFNMEPVHVFVSGVSAPHSPRRKERAVDFRKYSDDEFVEFLKSLGGTPAEIIENKDLMNIFLPALRADYELVNQFSYDQPSQRCMLTCPVDAFDGKDDIEHDLKSWNDITTGSFSITKLDGGHFYLKEPQNAELLCRHVSCALE